MFANLEKLKNSVLAKTLYKGPKNEKVIVHNYRSLGTTERIVRLFLKDSVTGFDIE